LVRLAPHAITELVAEFLAALGGECEADAGADEAAQREDADGPERARPGAAPLLEAQRLEHVVLVDVLEILEGLQPLLPDVLDHDGLQWRPAVAAHHVNADVLSPRQSAHERCGVPARFRTEPPGPLAAPQR